MASYVAATRIKAGGGYIEVGEKVEGLSAEAMKDLWAAGALKQVKEEAPKEQVKEPEKVAESQPTTAPVTPPVAPQPTK